MIRRRGFTLIELVVVIMILGILAGIASPKLIQTSGMAIDNGLKQTLAVVRDAIGHYASQNNGNLPPSTSAEDFRNALEPYLRSGFPKCPVGPTAGDPVKEIDVKFGTATSFSAPPKEDWYFNTITGHFFVNFGGATACDPSVNYDEL